MKVLNRIFLLYFISTQSLFAMDLADLVKSIVSKFFPMVLIIFGVVLIFGLGVIIYAIFKSFITYQKYQQGQANCHYNVVSHCFCRDCVFPSQGYILF